MEDQAPSSAEGPPDGSRAVSANQDASQGGHASQRASDQPQLEENEQQKEAIGRAFHLLDEEQCGRVMAE